MKQEVKDALELIAQGINSLRLTKAERIMMEEAFNLIVKEVTPVTVTEPA